MLAAEIKQIQLEPFDLQRWTQAPLQLEKVVELHWPVESTFDLLSNHTRWPRIFPWLIQVSVDNSRAFIKDGLGARRICYLGNGMLLEEVIVGWQPPDMYAYAGLDESHPFGMRGHVGVIRCESLVEVGTLLRWQHYFNHANPAAMREQLNSSLEAAMRNLIITCGGRLKDTISYRE